MNPTVTLTRDHHALRIYPACPQLAKYLRTCEHRLTADPQDGCRLEATPLALYEVIETNDRPKQQIGITMAGLEPVAAFVLRGCRVQGHIPVSLGFPDLDALRQRFTVDRLVLELVQQHERGLVYCEQQVDRGQLIAQIALAFPQLSIAIAGNNSAVKTVAAQLRRWLPREVLHVRADKIRPGQPRIVIGTYAGLMGGCMDLEQRRLVIALHAVEALGKLGIQLLQSAKRARLLGFLPLGLPIAPRDGDHLRGLFGFQETRVPRHGHQPLPVRVVVEKLPTGCCSGADSSVQPRRSAIWQNAIRNRRIALIARGFEADDRQSVRQFKRRYRSLRAEKLDRCALLAENLEHGIALAKQLPGWRLAAGTDVNLRGISRKNLAVFAAATKRSDTALPAIFTLQTANHIDPRRIDVLIRADAGMGLPPINPEKMMAPVGSNQQLLLVDFDDRPNCEQGRTTRKRLRAYRDHRWYRPGANPVEERVKEFLAARAKG